MKQVKDLLHERGVIVDKMTALLDAAENENRDLTADEQSQYDAMDQEQSALKNRAERLNRQDHLRNSLDKPTDNPEKPRITGGKKKSPFAQEEYFDGWRAWMRRGYAGIKPEIRNALEVGTDSEGGYIVPEEFETMLVESLQDWNDIRRYATVIQTSSDRHIPVEATLGSAAWDDEEAAYNESDAAFGRVTLNAYKATRIIKVSEELLADAFFDLPSYLARNFGKSFGLLEEAAFVAGTGSTHPTGIVTGASDSGIAFASETAITADEMIDVYHGLGRPYRRMATWILHDSTVKLIRKLKDGDNQYLWQPGLQAGQPDMILGRPLISSSSMPVAETDAKSVVFGDLSGYVIADRSNRRMQRLDELYAATGQIGFRMFSRTDGKVVDSNAIVYAVQDDGA